MGGVSIQLPRVVKTAVYAEAKPHCHLTRPRGLKKCTKPKNGCSRCVSDGVGSQQGALAEEHTRDGCCLSQDREAQGFVEQLSKCKFVPLLIIYMRHIFPQKFIKKKKPHHFLSHGKGNNF